jgi:tetrahydromethanopterin S-methyltransferase subunit B
MTLARKERSMDPHERPVVTEANKVDVRAGSTGNNVRYVVIGSIALALIAWILVAYFVRP